MSMYKLPSRRRKKINTEKPNINSLMDAAFIFIFFLLVTASFIKFYEINSDVPIVSNSEPPPDKKPLALTLLVASDSIDIYTGVPSTLRKKIGKTPEGKYDLEDLYASLYEIKKDNPHEKTAIMNPIQDVVYEDLIFIMDGIRRIRSTDHSIYLKDKSGIDIKVEELFSNVVFGNIQS